VIIRFQMTGIAATEQPAPEEGRMRQPRSDVPPVFPALFGLLAFCIAGCLYFVRSIVATVRGHQNSMAIFVLNVFLGWTILGWVGSLVWALTVVRRER
jgi:hypothetical protein